MARAAPLGLLGLSDLLSQGCATFVSLTSLHPGLTSDRAVGTEERTPQPGVNAGPTAGCHYDPVVHEAGVYAPQGQPHDSPGQSGAANAAERRPGNRIHQRQSPVGASL